MLGVTSPQGISPVTRRAARDCRRGLAFGCCHGRVSAWLSAAGSTRPAPGGSSTALWGAHRRLRDLYSGVIWGKGRSDEDNWADRRHELGIDPDLLPAHQSGGEGAAGWAALRPAGALQRGLRRDRSAAAPR